MIILLSRHGESEYNVQNRIGGDPDLSSKGIVYSEKLSNFVEKNKWFPKKIFRSKKKRSIQTSSKIDCWTCDKYSYTELNEINAGIAENLTFEEFSKNYPEEQNKRNLNKLEYKYPGGESYLDLISRTSNLCKYILEKNEDVFIISHQAITRVLLYHFLNYDINKIPHIEVPLHKIIMIKDGVMSFIDPE